MRKKKVGMKMLAWMMAVVMFLTMQGMPALSEVAEVKAAEREMPKNPVHHCTKDDEEDEGENDITDWSYVYFGSYPQSEIWIDEDDDDPELQAIVKAQYDANGDAWVNGTKYRRISKSDTNADYNFGDSAYRYFKWERIKWRVLKNDGKTLFVMADQGVDCKDYNEEYTSVTWENCTLRSWLNNDFYGMAFSSGEQGAIVSQTVVNEGNPYFYEEGGNDTIDKVFLLSLSEVVNLDYGFCDSSTYSVSRRVKVSDYAYTRGVGEGRDYQDNCIWWLRSPGDGTDVAANVYDSGWIRDYGYSVEDDSTACVPVLHINITSDLWSLTDDGTSGEGGSGNTGSQNDLATVENVIYSYGSKSIDVLTTAYSIETSHRPFDLICTPKDGISVTKYALYSGNKKVAETKNGKFEQIDASKFTSGKDVSIKVYGKQKVVTTQLLLEVKDKNLLVKSTLKLGGKDGLALSLGDEVPFVGGNDISVNLPEIPVNAIVEDGKIKVGINIKEKELYSSNSYEGVTTTTKKKTMKQKIKDWKYTLYRTGNINKDWEGYLEKSNLKADMPFMANKAKYTVFGYAEAEWSDQLETVSGEIVIAISGSATFQKQLVIMTVPVTLNCTVTGKGEADAEIKYDFINQDWSGNIKLDGSVALEPYAGVGVGTWLSVGVYGQGKLGVRMSIIPFDDVDVYLSGEVGVKGYFAKKEVAKVPLLSFENLKKTGWGQYINDNNELLLYSMKENSYFNRKSAKSMNTNFSDVEFIWNESKNSLFRSAPVGDIRAVLIVENAYGAAEPQIISVNGTTLMAYLDNDASRALPNQTVVKYAVYNSVSGEFSVPQIAVNDSTADYKPQLFTDGTDIYLYYLDSTESYNSNEDPDIHEYAGSFAVTVAKYDAYTNAFLKLGTVSRTGHYCYAPVLERREEGLFLAWAENESDDVFGLTEDNSINYAVFSDGAWSDPVCIAENLNSITSIDSGKLGDDTAIAYSIDVDNDMTTEEQKICIADESGNITEVMRDSASNLQFVDLPGVNQPVLAFSRNGSVEYIKNVSDQPVKLLEEGTMDSKNRFIVMGEKIYYLKTTDKNSRNIYCASYVGGEWGSVVLTDESAYVDAFSVSDNKLVYLLTDADTGVSESGDSETITSSKIKFLASTETHDLKIANVDFDALNINAGEDLNLELDITNNGTEAVENPVVSFYLKSAPDSRQNVKIPISMDPGETIQENVTVTAPEDFSDAVYAVEVAETGYQDCRETDNVEEIDISKTELEIETEYKIIRDEKLLSVYVSNDSNVSSEACVTVTDSNGSAIYIEDNVSVLANDCVDISIPLDDLQLDENGETILTAAVNTNTEEYYLCNNTYEQRIWEIDTWQPVVSDISDEKDDDITNPNKNNGSSSVKNPSTSTTTVKAPGKIKLKNLKSVGKRKLKVNWKWVVSDGFQIQYALNKKFTKSNKTKYAGWLNSSINLKKLKSKKKYFVRIRAYNVDYSGRVIYGPWSNVKKCKVK